MLFLYWSHIDNGKSGQLSICDRKLNCEFYMFYDFSCLILYVMASILKKQRKPIHSILDTNNGDDNNTAFIELASEQWGTIGTNLGILKLKSMSKSEWQRVKNNAINESFDGIPSKCVISNLETDATGGTGLTSPGSDTNGNELPSMTAIAMNLASMPPNIDDFVVGHSGCKMDCANFFFECQHRNKSKSNQSNKSEIFCSHFLIRHNVDCLTSQMTMNLYSLFNAIWSPYNHSCIVNDDLEIDNLLRLKIVYTVCNSVTKDFGFWEIQNESVLLTSLKSLSLMDLFIDHFIVTSAAKLSRVAVDLLLFVFCFC